MKLLDAIAIGMELLAKFEQAKKTGGAVPVNWSKRISKYRLWLKGNLGADRLE